MTETLPLAGYRVLDLTTMVMGPFASQILGDLGADVITVEAPGLDPLRSLGPGIHPQFSDVALNLLRNKRNLGLDLTKPEGRDALVAVIATCDVFLTNLRPGSLDRLGLSYERVAEMRPDIVFCRASGFSSSSPDADAPAYDDVIQATSGLVALAERPFGEPRLLPTLLADKVCGLVIANAITAALLGRATSGAGRQIEIAMADAMRSFTLTEHCAGRVAADTTAPAGLSRVLSPRRRPQATADGWVMIMPYTAAQFAALFEAVNDGAERIHPDLYTTEAARRANAGVVFSSIAAFARSRTTAECLATCRDIDVPAAPVTALDDIVDALPIGTHPVAGRYRVIPPIVPLAGESPVRFHAPVRGQDDLDVLREAGLGDAIEHLRELGVIGDVDSSSHAAVSTSHVGTKPVDRSN